MGGRERRNLPRIDRWNRRLGARLKWRKTVPRPRFLALLVAGFHADTRVWPRRINRAAIVCAQKWTGASARDDDRFHIRPDFQNYLHHGFAAVMRVGIDQPRLAQNVEVIRLDNGDSFAARAALIAFINGHTGSEHSATVMA